MRDSTAMKGTVRQACTALQLALIATALLMGLASRTQAQTAVLVNPQIGDFISGRVNPPKYLINGLAHNADTVLIEIFAGIDTTVPPLNAPAPKVFVRGGAWEYIWDVGNYGKYPSGTYTIRVTPYVQGTSGPSSQASVSLENLSDDPEGPPPPPIGANLSLLPTSVVSSLFANSENKGRFNPGPAAGYQIGIQLHAYADDPITLTGYSADPASAAPSVPIIYAPNPMAINDDNGHFRATIDLGDVPDGLYSVWGTINTASDVLSVRRTVLLDKKPPVISFVPQTAQMDESAGVRFPSKDVTRFTGTVRDWDLAGTTTVSGIRKVEVHITDSNGAVVACNAVLKPGSAASDNVTWTADYTQMAAGTYKFRIVAYDNAGNRSSTTEYTLVLNRTNPALTITSPAAGSYVSSMSLVAVVNNKTLTAGNFRVWVNGAEVAVASGEVTSAAGVTTLTKTINGAEGPKSILVEATDGQKNSSQATVLATRDTTAPGVLILEPNDRVPDGTQDGAIYVKGSTVNLRGAVSDNYQLKSWRWSYKKSTDATYTDIGALNNVAGTFADAVDTFDTSAKNGSYTVRLRAWDQANNEGQAAVNVVVDNLAPKPRITAPTSNQRIGGGTVTLTGVLDPNGGVAEANLASWEFRDNGNPIPGAKGTSSTINATWNTQGLIGTHTLTLYAIDKAGNAGTSAPVYVRIDNEKPVVTLNSPGRYVTGTVAITGSVIDDDPQVSWKVYYDPGAVQIGADGTGSTISRSWTTPADVEAPYSLYATAEDANENQTQSGKMEVRVDNRAPRITSQTTVTPVSATVLRISATFDELYPRRYEVWGRYNQVNKLLAAGSITYNGSLSKPISYDWNITSEPTGRHTVWVVLYDEVNHSTQSSALVTSVQGVAPATPTLTLVQPTTSYKEDGVVWPVQPNSVNTSGQRIFVNALNLAGSVFTVNGTFPASVTSWFITDNGVRVYESLESPAASFITTGDKTLPRAGSGVALEGRHVVQLVSANPNPSQPAILDVTVDSLPPVVTVYGPISSPSQPYVVPGGSSFTVTFKATQQAGVDQANQSPLKDITGTNNPVLAIRDVGTGKVIRRYLQKVPKEDSPTGKEMPGDLPNGAARLSGVTQHQYTVTWRVATDVPPFESGHVYSIQVLGVQDVVLNTGNSTADPLHMKYIRIGTK